MRVEQEGKKGNSLAIGGRGGGGGGRGRERDKEDVEKKRGKKRIRERTFEK